VKIKPPLRTLPAAPNPPAFSYLVTIRVVLCLAFILLKLPMQAQSSRQSDQEDIYVDVNIYEGENSRRKEVRSFYNDKPKTSVDELDFLEIGFTPLEISLQKIIAQEFAGALLYIQRERDEIERKRKIQELNLREKEVEVLDAEARLRQIKNDDFKKNNSYIAIQKQEIQAQEARDCYSADLFSISSGLAAGKTSAPNQGAESRPRSSGGPWNSHLAQEFRGGGLMGFLQNFLPIGEKICRKRRLDRQGRRG